MIKQFALLAAQLLCICSMSAQQVADTLLVYTIASKTTGTLLPVQYPATVTNAFTSSSTGNLSFTSALSVTAPNTNLLSGSGYSQLAKASSFFPTTSYPARTVVRLTSYLAGKQKYVCTGMLVGPCHVLANASGFSPSGPGQGDFYDIDSVLINPAFDNGKVQSSLPNTTANRIYKFKVYPKNIYECFILIELNQAIGNTIGWTGIGFNNTPNFIAGKVFHKFSYPNDPTALLTPKIYNGDTLYYNYGTINDSPPFYVVNSPQSIGIFGQDGSTFMYTDNINYYSIAMLQFSTNQMHAKLSQSAYFQLKNILTSNRCQGGFTNVEVREVPISGPQIFPNPFNDKFVVQFDFDPLKRYELLIFSPAGNKVKQMELSSGYNEILKTNMSAGLYTFVIKCNGVILKTVTMVTE